MHPLMSTSISMLPFPTTRVSSRMQLMWTDVVRIKEKVVELQVTAAHPTLGRMGCSLSIQNLHLRVGFCTVSLCV